MPDARTPLDPLAVPPAPPLGLGARVRASIAKTPAARSSFRERLLLALLAIPLAVAAGPLGSRIIFAARPFVRVDLNDLPVTGLAERLAIILVVAGVGTGIALAPGRRGFGAKVTFLVTTTLVVAPLYTLATAIHPLRTAAGDAAARHLHPLGAPCALVALVVGVLALAAFGVALRRAVPVAPVSRGAALGAAAGAWAGVALFLQCPANDALHILVGHALPVAAFAIAGAIALPRLLRP